MRFSILPVVTCISIVIYCSTASTQTAPADSTPSTERHALFSELLSQYVSNGRVDYEHLRNDERLNKYLLEIAGTDPDTITERNDRFAFWINAYNAYTLKIICDNYPLESINDLSFGGRIIGHLLSKTVWDNEFAVVNDKAYTLNEIEHDIIRPRFRDARAHFALVCASRSCPPLRSEAYEGYKLDTQLDNQGTIFFSQTTKNYFDEHDRKAYLSPILDWFSNDFGESDREILLYVTGFLSEHLARSIEHNPDDWEIEYRSFDWKLND